MARRGTKRKYHLLKWEKICKNKKKGGLGIKNLRKMNVSLPCKWWWKLEKEDGLWQRIVRYKYLRNNSIHNVSHKLNDSHIWSDLLKVKEVYLLGRDVSIKDGCYGKMHGCTSNLCVRLLLYFLPCVILKMLWLIRLGMRSL